MPPSNKYLKRTREIKAQEPDTDLSVILVVVASRGEVAAHPDVAGQPDGDVPVGLADHLEQKLVPGQLVGDHGATSTWEQNLFNCEKSIHSKPRFPSKTTTGKKKTKKQSVT